MWLMYPTTLLDDTLYYIDLLIEDDREGFYNSKGSSKVASSKCKASSLWFKQIEIELVLMERAKKGTGPLYLL